MRLSAYVRVPKEDVSVLSGLPRRVPGVSVRGGGFRSAELTLPDHAVHLLRPFLSRPGWSVEWRNPGALRAMSAAPDDDFGIRVLRRLEADGVLRPGVAETYYDYQRAALGYVCHRGSGHLWMACGAGKTRIAMAWALSVPGPVVFVTRVALTLKVAREVRALTHLEPHVWLAPSRRRKSYEPTSGYLARCAAARATPFVVVGQENLPDALPDLFLLARVRGLAVVFDEVHRLSSWRRWEATMVADDGGNGVAADGAFRVGRAEGVRFELRENVAAAAWQLSQKADRRLGASATPVPDRVRNLWAPMDLVDPWEWGGFYDFAYRYAGARPGPFGGIDTTGATHLDELRDRLEWVAWATPLSVVQAELPPMREDVVWLGPEDLREPLGGWVRELRQAARGGAESVLEAHVAMTASRKRRWTVGQAADALDAGQKVLIFTGRRRDAEDVAGALSKRSTAPVRWCHGGLDTEDLQAAVDDYMGTRGPACLVATHDSIGDGQDLQDTDLCLAVMLPYSPVKATQMKGRVSRPGQTRPVLFRWAVAQGTMDERVMAILLPKLGTVEGLMQDASAADTAAVLRDVDGQGALLEELAALVTAGAAVDWSAEPDGDGDAGEVANA